jgi:hypothetical protein
MTTLGKTVVFNNASIKHSHVWYQFVELEMLNQKIYNTHRFSLEIQSQEVEN